MTWKENLISLYLHISESKAIENYLLGLRMSNNYKPEFTDQEIMTIYLFGIHQNQTKVKHIYAYTRQHLLDWFPKLPSYEAFSNRLNKLSGAFELLTQEAINKGRNQLTFTLESVIDSMPIIVAGNSRSSSAKTAKEICAKGYCSSKGMYYHGLKLHLLGFVRPYTLPMPEYCWFTSAEANDLNAAKDVLEHVFNRKIYADKIYYAEHHAQELMQNNNTMILAPIKKAKGQKLQDAADNLFSAAVSGVRQPIESFFNWLNEKTQIQNATKVRSAAGLMTHVWGKLAAALLLLIF